MHVQMTLGPPQNWHDPANFDLNRNFHTLPTFSPHRQHFPSCSGSGRSFEFGWMGLVAIVIVAFWLGNTPIEAQQDRPRVVTVESGVQYEGEIFQVPELSAATYSFTQFVPSGSDIVVVDDGMRLVMLNRNRVAKDLGESRIRDEVEFELNQRDSTGSTATGVFLYASAFNEFGHREFSYSDGKQNRTYIQGITRITPRYCVVETLTGQGGVKQWTMRIPTGAVPKSVLRNLLLTNIDDPKNPNEYFKIAQFFQQRRDFQQASEELRLIEANPLFANRKDQIREGREVVGQLFARQILDEIRLRSDAGQYNLALGLAQATKDREGLAGQIKQEFKDIEVQQSAAQQNLTDYRQAVFDLIQQTTNVDPSQVEAIQRFKVELETDLNRFNAPRLDAYMNLIKDVSIPNEEKISLAMSGWLLGSNLAKPNLAETQSMFIVRDLVREYLTSGTPAETRSQILTKLAEYESGAPEYLDPIIKNMKPIAPPADLAQYTGEKPIEFSIEIPGPAIDPTPRHYRCLAHLPPEYDPYRKYPLILTLPGNSQTLEQNLLMWCGNHNVALSNKLQTPVRDGHAMRNGYIVVAVEWRDRGQSTWQYSAREHKVVIDALYQALRKFSVDSDRVFLSGHRGGGDGAYDIGISHPEHWAGVLGFSGKMGKYINMYRENQNGGMAMYCVFGQKDIFSLTDSVDSLNKWLKGPRNFEYVDATVVYYKGRANELFLEDIPEAIKWMQVQRRRWPQDGFEFECNSLRPWDSYFWFFELHGISEDFVAWPELFESVQRFKKLPISGRVSQNTFLMEPKNTKVVSGATIWLSPEFVDFSQTIEIKNPGSFKGDVKPSRKVLLDDVLRRAEREHPYWGRIDMNAGRWSVGK